MSGFRRNGRKPANYRVKLSHENAGEFVAEMIDISDSGMYLFCPEALGLIAVGDLLNAQVFHSDLECASSQQIRVVRTTNEGAAFAFN